jgi:hypothetical protein
VERWGIFWRFEEGGREGGGGSHSWRRHTLRRVSELQCCKDDGSLVRRAWAVGSGRQLPQPSMAERFFSPWQRQAGIKLCDGDSCNGRRNMVCLIALCDESGNGN